MRVIDNEFTDVGTPAGAMRTYLFRPRSEGVFPGVVLFSEIFQVTHQIRRAAAMLAGHGYLVAVPEVFHESLPAGRALPYSEEGRTQGRRLVSLKAAAARDADIGAVIDMLRHHRRCSGRIGALGFCYGGQLALRAAVLAEVRAAAAFYPTGLIGEDGCPSDCLDRLPEVTGELSILVGTEDPLLPLMARSRIYQALAAAGCRYRWHEVPAGHGYVRDGGEDYDPELCLLGYQEVFSLFRRNLSE